jgi:predicted NAD/FAD-binding protein
MPFDAVSAGRPLCVAVIGSGISGLGAAWLLSRHHDVALYEKEARFGGHTNTFVAAARGPGGRVREIPVDTGFIVFNDATYPNLIALFAHLGVECEASNMSFSASIDRGRIEYSGGTWHGLFAQKRNLLRPSHWRMLADIVRFFREARGLCEAGGEGPDLATFLARGGYSRAFVDRHLLPMAAAIWSCPTAAMMGFPAHSLARFFRNHGLLQVFDRPLWRTVKGGARVYRDRLLADIGPRALARAGAVRVAPGADGIVVHDTAGGARKFDRVVLACHADEALKLVAGPTQDECDILGRFAFQPNRAVLHQDRALMPVRKRAWSSWNYLAAHDSATGARAVSVTYWMNRLQNLPDEYPLFVSLNPLDEPRADATLATFDYMHPVFDAAAIAAQRRLPEIQGKRGLYFCGAWTGHGFHEDGLRSGLAVAEMLGVRTPWAESAPAAMPQAAD